VVQYWADMQSVHGFRCCDNIHVCKLIALYSANAYTAEHEMSASARTRSMPGCCLVPNQIKCVSWAFIVSRLLLIQASNCSTHEKKRRTMADAFSDSHTIAPNWKPLGFLTLHQTSSHAVDTVEDTPSPYSTPVDVFGIVIDVFTASPGHVTPPPVSTFHPTSDFLDRRLVTAPVTSFYA